MCLSTDSTFYGVEKDYPRYGKLALWLEIWQEKRAFQRSARVITHSEWSGKILSDFYKVPKNRIIVYPEPSTLPDHVVPKEIYIEDWKTSNNLCGCFSWAAIIAGKGSILPLKLSIRLNAAGIRAELTVCGAQGQA